jgi:nucleotide-binding universal stress UspA family protein
MLSETGIETRTYAGASPAHVICDLTDREALDLVVVGSPHRGAIGRALIGSVAEALLHGAGAPVLLAPRGYALGDHGAPGRIAVAFDTTPESKVALRHAESLALTTGAFLEVLTVWPHRASPRTPWWKVARRGSSRMRSSKRRSPTSTRGSKLTRVD